MSEPLPPKNLNGVDLRPITLGDASLISDAARAYGMPLWASSFPFLIWYNHSKARDITITELGGMVIVGLLRRIRGTWHLDALIPPLGDAGGSAVLSAYELLSQANGDRSARVIWADAKTTGVLGKLGGYEVRFSEYEYIYRPQETAALIGGRYGQLRKYLRRAERMHAPLVRAFAPEDAEACRTVHKSWIDDRKDKKEKIFDSGYTHAALDLAGDLPQVEGLVAEVDGVVTGFALWSGSPNGWCAFLVLKVMPGMRYLSSWLRWRAMRAISENWDIVNDAGDLGKTGLAQQKRLFVPHAYLPTFSISCK